jgi:hypothetical protein
MSADMADMAEESCVCEVDGERPGAGCPSAFPDAIPAWCYSLQRSACSDGAIRFSSGVNAFDRAYVACFGDP